MNRPVDGDRIARYIEGELPTSEAQELEQALESSGELREAVARERALHAALGVSDELVVGLERTTTPAWSRPRAALDRRAVILGGLLAAGLAAAALLMFRPASEFRSRSGGADDGYKWSGIKVLEHGRPVGTAIPPDASLVFSYSNLGDAPFDFLMIFGVDATGKCRWYHPAWTDDGADPVAIPIAQGAADVVLPHAIRHPLPPGELTLHGLFLRAPLSVRDVEARLQNLDFEHAFDHRIVLEVR